MKQPPIVIPEGCTEVLLHACCAPCSSAILEWLLANGVRPTIFYYNPNIWPREEYEIRKNESKRHAEGLGIRWIDGDYDHEEWRNEVSRCEVRGARCEVRELRNEESMRYDVETEPERGRRCEQCFTLRLTAAARKAQELGIRYFATTLASSRWKSLEQIERAGRRAEQIVNESTQKALGSAASPSEEPSLLCTFWAQNWRKGGLQERRNQLLKEYGFYNQQYCGCEFSARGAGALTKPLLREQMRVAKRQHAQQLAQWSADICKRLAARLLLPTPQPVAAGTPSDSRSPLTVMAYWPLPDEVNISPLADRLVAEGHTVLLPKITGEETMELRRYTHKEDLREGSLHIMEPDGEVFTDYARIDIALIPGMAFDAAGHRLGRGRGYYDRFLALCPNVLKIGVCFPFQRVPLVPTGEHDVVMNELA